MQAVSTIQSSPREDDDYESLHQQIRSTFTGPWQLETPLRLFTTDATGLFDAFLAGLHADRRQHYTCHACRHFFERYAGLVHIDAKGVATPAFWDRPAPPFFAGAIAAVERLVSRARVTGVFVEDAKVWGTASSRSDKALGGSWSHIHAIPRGDMVFKPGPLKTCFQVMAEKHEEFGMLSRGLAEFSVETVRQAHSLLTTGALYRSEKCIGVAKWLLDLHEAREAMPRKDQRENMVWRAVASAPPGFAHVRSTMISTLLEDIEAGKSFEDIKRAFDAKMNPTVYQRPQAAPTEGQLAAAESVVGKLASAGSLARRFARLEDVLPHALWTPKPAKADAPAGGVFGHLKPKKAGAAHVAPPPLVMTWEKFARTVLPEAERLEVCVPGGNSSFFAFMTAADPNAPPILQWDREDRRNPVSWYLYATGSPAGQWNMTAGSWVEVMAITKQPSGWTVETTHQGDGAYLILRGARDVRGGTAGLGLFPEIMKSDYHGIRAAIEAYSRAGKPEGADEASACGIAMPKGSPVWNHVVRATSKGSVLSYRVDRWD